MMCQFCPWVDICTNAFTDLSDDCGKTLLEIIDFVPRMCYNIDS